MVLHKAVVVDVDGALRTVDVDQRRMHEFLGGPVTICGAIPELYAVALRRRDEDGVPRRHRASRAVARNFFDDCGGPIVIVGSDREGEACDVDTERVCARLLTEADPPSPCPTHR